MKANVSQKPQTCVTNAFSSAQLLQSRRRRRRQGVGEALGGTELEGLEIE